jgi:hypothetical protein
MALTPEDVLWRRPRLGLQKPDSGPYRGAPGRTHGVMPGSKRGEGIEGRQWGMKRGSRR